MANVAKNRLKSTWTPLNNEEANRKVGVATGLCPLAVYTFQLISTQFHPLESYSPLLVY